MTVYKVISPENRGGFGERIEEILASVSRWLEDEATFGRKLCYSKVFLSDAQNQYTEYENSALSDLLGHAPSAIIEQPPTDGSKVAVLLATSDIPQNFTLDTLRLDKTEADRLGTYQQAVTLFERYIKGIAKSGLDMSTNLVRTWIYVADIDTNYHDVVKARNDIFARHGLTADTHFIASTGIGGNTHVSSASVAIDFLTYPDIKEDDKKYLKALTHLNPTHEYGVAFERGTRLSLQGENIFYISGTASIDHKGKVVNVGNVVRQADRLLENIEALLADGGGTMADIGYLIVYLRDFSDHAIIDSYMKQRFPNTPYIIVLAKVCRPQWLIEMECVARR